VLPDGDVREFLRRSLGYTLTGEIGAQCFWILIGPGANGKSTMLDVMRRLMGDYAVPTKFDVFVQHQKQGSAISPRDGLATLEGSRLVCASESDQERKISPGVIKAITGESQLRAAKMYEQDRAFDITFKIWLSTNAEPLITDTSEGMWRRIHRLNFDVIIPPHERDPRLAERLVAEGAGILNWCLAGLRDYREGGMKPPKTVLDAVAEYRTSQDIVGRWLVEQCVVTRNKGEVFTSTKDLYRDFRGWAVANGEADLNSRWFARELAKRLPNTKRNGDRGFAWVTLKRTAPEVY
jgi:putative DNA primase/helicase